MGKQNMFDKINETIRKYVYKFVEPLFLWSIECKDLEDYFRKIGAYEYSTKGTRGN